MLFNDYPFLLVFLPTAILIYRLVDPYPRLRIGVLVLLSFAFYACGNPPFIALLAFSILINWLAALAYGRTKIAAILTAALIADLAILAVFKYAQLYWLQSWSRARCADSTTRSHPAARHLVLHVSPHHVSGQSAARQGAALSARPLRALHLLQALAGPLVGWSEVMQQFGRQVYSLGWQREFCVGLAFIATGLFEKIFLGDRVAVIIDPVYAQAAAGPVANGDAWQALSFAVQILCDFGGYSDIAIGLGLLFGITLPFNFNAPFRSTNIQDFWQRWHITLMTFLREYVFHPLVNKRVVPRRWLPVQYFGAMLFTMALCGLWHGASWTFVLWGTIHGIALVICSLWRRYGPRLPFLLGWALTVSFVLLSGVIFRASTLDAAFNFDLSRKGR
jgi:alginate O-acetyltransferase complex protein AlgI